MSELSSMLKTIGFTSQQVERVLVHLLDLNDTALRAKWRRELGVDMSRLTPAATSSFGGHHFCMPEVILRLPPESPAFVAEALAFAEWTTLCNSFGYDLRLIVDRKALFRSNRTIPNFAPSRFTVEIVATVERKGWLRSRDAVEALRDVILPPPFSR